MHSPTARIAPGLVAMVLFDIFETREAKRCMQRHAMKG